MKQYAKILSLCELKKYRDSLGRIVCTSGGFDPIHPGHVTTLVESKQYGDTLIVIVNGNEFLINKKGYAFMDLKARCTIVSCIKGVDYVVPYETQNDFSVSRALMEIRPNIFTKGGDRFNKETIPEWDICIKLGIEVLVGVGREPNWSSSYLLEKWSQDTNRLESRSC